MTPAPRARIEAHELVEVGFEVNGSRVSVSVPPRMHLADALRERVGLTGTHLGCEHGVCGMCTVLVDGVAARACLLFAVQCEGASVVTVEGLGAPGDQHPLQRALAAHHGLQCGFCTPGMLISGYDLLANGPEGTGIDPARLPIEMSGVLCRCTGYRGILAAVADVAGAYPDGLPPPGNCAPRPLLGRGGARAGAGAPEAVPEVPPREAPAGASLAGDAAPATELSLPRGAPSASVEVRAELAAPLEAVWRVLSDFEQLARCLPGVSVVGRLGEDRYAGRASVALGPVTLSFQGTAQVLERDAPEHRMRVVAHGADTGGNTTGADIRISAVAGPGGGTVLLAAAGLYLTGRIAQFGRALAGDVGKRMFERFAEAVDVAATTGAAPDAGGGPNPARILLAVLVDRARRAVARLRRPGS